MKNNVADQFKSFFSFVTKTTTKYDLPADQTISAIHRTATSRRPNACESSSSDVNHIWRWGTFRVALWLRSPFHWSSPEDLSDLVNVRCRSFVPDCTASLVWLLLLLESVVVVGGRTIWQQLAELLLLLVFLLPFVISSPKWSWRCYCSKIKSSVGGSYLSQCVCVCASLYVWVGDLMLIYVHFKLYFNWNLRGN